jgi:DNA invertase Pin-like site-specific DNA recombinase
MPTVCIYCRVSSAEQERRGTIEAQRTTLTAYAERHGYTVSAGR